MDTEEPRDQPPLEDQLDHLVGEYSDALAAGRWPDHAEYLERVDPTARPGLERYLKMIDAGMAAAPSGALPLVPGARFGRYELKRELGRGGMALVWLATDDELRRPVALKILRPGLALEKQHTDRFRREAQAMARLKHPNIVEVHDVGEAHGHHYLAMEYVEGPSLSTVLEALQRERFSADELRRAAGAPRLAPGVDGFEQAVAAILMQVADALATAHETGLVHRDVKPSNILLRADGSAVVADFGLAMSDGDPALSMTGDVLGTPYYMSPEQAQLSGTRVDHRTDVYSLGVTLYEVLCGELPFSGGSALEVFEAIKNQLPRSIRAHDKRISKEAASIVRVAMAHDPGERYASAEALRDDLEALATGRPVWAFRRYGGALRRVVREARWIGSGLPYEYCSDTTLLGLPLVHIHTGRRYPGQRWRVAKGWVAVGDSAFGGVCVGTLSVGLMSLGGLSFGVLTSMGGVSAALGWSAGGVSLAGLISTGGLSLALWLAIGGIAWGHASIGGIARGNYVMGGDAQGDTVLSGERRDVDEQTWWEGAAEPLESIVRWFLGA